MLEIVESEKDITLDEVKELESLIGCQLPNEYKQFMLQYNGGRPKLSGFRFSLNQNDWSVAMVAWFLAFYDGEYENITDFYHTFRVRIPSMMLAIARDPGGSLILLGLEGENKGKVFFWLQELEGDDGEEPSYDNVAFVANSFNEFLNSLIEIE